jgi:bacteriorhodopsin
MSELLLTLAKVDLTEFAYYAIGLAALVIVLLILKPR